MNVRRNKFTFRGSIMFNRPWIIEKLAGLNAAGPRAAPAELFSRLVPARRVIFTVSEPPFPDEYSWPRWKRLSPVTDLHFDPLSMRPVDPG